MEISRGRQLMLRVAEGNLGAFEEIVLGYQRFVWGVAYRFLGDAAEAEDITQETFLRVLKAAARYKPTANFRTYLYRIVSRLCIDYTRKKHPIFTDSPPDVADGSPEPAVALAIKERDAEVRRAMDSLPPRQRMAVILKYYERLSYADIAQTLGISVKAVERLLSRARTVLKVCLSKKKQK